MANQFNIIGKKIILDMELKPQTPLLIFLKEGVSKSNFNNLSEYFGLNSEIYYSLPKSRMNCVWGRINSNKNKVILARYNDYDSLISLIKNFIYKIHSNYFHILLMSHEIMDFEYRALNIFDEKNINYDIISLYNGNFSKL